MWAISLTVASGCESDDAKLKRLELASTVDCLRAERALNNFSYALDSLSGGDSQKESKLLGSGNAQLGSLGESAGVAKRKCELAERDYNRFMR